MDTKLLKKAAEFHGHTCPGLALGVRVSALALKEFSGRARDEELVAIVENDSCAVDAIQVLTGCSFGKGNLIFRDYGKQVYTFIKRRERGIKGLSGDALRVSVHWKSPEETPAEKAMWQRYMNGERTEEVLKAVHRRRSGKIKAILEASDEELFKIKRLKMEPPCEARISPSVICAECGEKTMETKLRVIGGRQLCQPCFEKTACRR
ncbi:MAG: FmdE family protein [Nitrospiraceae bacterium]|nr:FmdE family protein [Nitrospiraceae bacterium]